MINLIALFTVGIAIGYAIASIVIRHQFDQTIAELRIRKDKQREMERRLSKMINDMNTLQQAMIIATRNN